MQQKAKLAETNEGERRQIAVYARVSWSERKNATAPESNKSTEWEWSCDPQIQKQ